MDTTITFTVNGRRRTVTTDPRRPLLGVLREDLQLTGTKFGCGEGRCGACTVLVDGKRTFSCLAPVQAAADKAVLTIEGLSEDDEAQGEEAPRQDAQRGEAPPDEGPGNDVGPAKGLHPVQEAFLAEGAFQCGYCTPGMVMATVALLDEKPGPGDAEILSWMNKNLCRCCGYPKVLSAVRRAVATRAGKGGGERHGE